MKKILCLLVFSAIVAVSPVFGVDIVPKPASLVETGESVQLPKSLTFNVGTPELKDLVSVWAETFAPIALAEETKTKMRADVLLLVDEALEAEEYRLVIADAPNKVVISGGSPAGVWWGLQSFAQVLVQNQTVGGFNAPCLSISDKPFFSYRSGMLDCCRHFFTVDEVKKFIDILALHKLNTFHWHLTEDQGWRIEIKKYPLLTEVGSIRKETVVGHARGSDEYDGTPHGGFYTQDEIRDIVKYAADRQITIIPEIEMPGHASAALASYPELGCRGEGYEVCTTWGVMKEIFCAGNDKTLEFLKDVYDEVCELFPSEYIHVGGDEAPTTRWEECPKCQAKKAELGLEKTAYLHGYMLREIEKHLNAKGKKIIGWDEILDADVTPTATIMSWRGPAGGIRAAKQGNHVVMSPNSYYYLDYYQTDDPEANGEPLAIGGYLPLPKTYSFDPFDELDEDQKQYITGIQANLWTEYIGDFDLIQHMFMPRCCGLSEVAWGSEKEDYEAFRQRVVDAMVPLYNALGLKYAKYDLKEALASKESVLDKVREAFVEASVSTYAVEEDVWNRFIESSNHGKANDVLLLQLYMSVHLPDAEVERLLDLFDFEEGCFKDIDYASGERGSWPATLHVTRLQSLTKLYKAGSDKWKGSETLKTLIHAGMAYWFRTMPVCPNWWHNDIGVPKKMTTILLMLRDELSEDEIAGGLKVLERSQFGKTGQNKVWLAGNNLMKGLLMDDEALVIRARDYIAEEICVTDAEGIQDDWSFHQHGPQIQFGNYGLAYADGLAFWCRVLAGTKYMFTEEQTELFSNFMKEGLCRCVFKGMMDPSFCGRQVFIDAGRGKVLSLAVAAQNMAVAMNRMADAVQGSPEGESMAERYRSEAEFYNAVSRENLYLTDSGSSVNGAKYFNRSDCGIYRTKDWYSSVRMHSERTIGFEFTNKENTLANFSADGAVLLMQDGGEYENIFACWDWRKVPGVTAYDDGKPIKSDDSMMAKRNKTSHVGGLTASTSSGEVMAASMELNRDGLHALKSTFFFDDCIIALGADISVKNRHIKEVTTAVDQTRLNGKVTYDKSATDSEVHTGVRWVHHNNRGYVSLDGVGMNVTEGIQKGKWDYIEPSFKEKWDEMAIFKCWFEHPLDGLKDGETGSYAYAILPCTSASDTKAFEKKVSEGGEKSPVKVLMNTDGCQAVSHNGVICAIVHKAGQYELDGEVLEAESPCIIISDGENVKKEYIEEGMDAIADKVFKRAAAQFKLLDKNTDEVEIQAAGSAAVKLEKLFPRMLHTDGELETANYIWWCSGFYPGCLWIMYERTGNPEWKDLALKYTLPLEPLKDYKNNHDIGFQLMCSYGRALQLTGNKEYEKVLKEGAATLAGRFSENVGCIKSWDNNRWKFPVIIDNMMNLELLFTGLALGGDESLKEIAIRHAETTMKNHFRDDYSTWHVVDYDPEDGHVLGKQTWQGYSDDSAWSRGQSWGLYGYTMVYRFTKDVKFRNWAVNIAEYIISRLPEDGVPYWDFDAPNIPNEERDASAGAVIASALIELSGYVDAEKASRYQAVARKILRTLASDEYLAKEGEINGFLLKHSVGAKPLNGEIDVPLPYADYYFLEALMRYLEICE